MTADGPPNLTKHPGNKRKPRSSSTFKQCDLTRALRAASAAGIGVSSVVIDKSGRIVLETSLGRTPATTGAINEWDAIE